jgi:hypothetical protein
MTHASQKAKKHPGAVNSGFDSFGSIVERVVLSSVGTMTFVGSMITKHYTSINQIAAMQYTRD